MTVSIQATSKKYRGRKAETYDEIRMKQRRWAVENEAVAAMVQDLKRGTTVLDCPVGTGRFLDTWKKRGFDFLGVDYSDEMLDLAKSKGWPKGKLVQGDASALELGRQFDVGVYVRFLDLIDESAVYRVLTCMDKTVRKRFICTIRFGIKYVPKANTAEHDEKKFSAWMKRHGWKETERVPVFDAGWHVLRYDR